MKFEHFYKIYKIENINSAVEWMLAVTRNALSFFTTESILAHATTAAIHRHHASTSTSIAWSWLATSKEIFVIVTSTVHVVAIYFWTRLCVEVVIKAIITAFTTLLATVKDNTIRGATECAAIVTCFEDSTVTAFCIKGFMRIKVK